MQIVIGWDEGRRLFQAAITINDVQFMAFFITAKGLVTNIQLMPGMKEVSFANTLDQPDKAFIKTMLNN